MTDGFYKVPEGFHRVTFPGPVKFFGHIVVLIGIIGVNIYLALRVFPCQGAKRSMQDEEFQVHAAHYSPPMGLVFTRHVLPLSWPCAQPAFPYSGPCVHPVFPYSDSRPCQGHVLTPCSP